MNWKKIAKKYRNLNIFIILALFLSAFSLFYFLYYRQRNKAQVYISAILTTSRPEQTNYGMSYYWIPYWITDAITIGDRDNSPLGGINALVMDKEEYKAWSYGKFINLILKINAVKDRSGVYLYKNKPLLVGNIIELKLPKVQTNALVTYIGSDLPNFPKEKLILKLKQKQIESWIADKIKIGSEIKNNKEETIVKVVDKKESLATPIGINYESRSGRLLYSNEADRKDVELTIEILAENINGEYYFQKIRKIKTNESLYLPFNEVSIDFPIISIEK